MRKRNCSKRSTAYFRPALALTQSGQLSVSPNCSKSVMRNGARRTRRTGLEELPSVVVNSGALIRTLPPSSSRAFRSPGCNRLIVRAFTTTLAASTSAVFDPTSGPKFVHCSNRESRGPGRRMDGCSGLHQTGSPNCAKEGTARLPSLLSYAVLPSRPN